MTSLFELLAGGLPSEAEYRADNPLFNAARGMASIQVQPRTSAEAWWMPATQGLLSGFLQGAGKAQAREAQYSDIKALPGIQQLLAPSPDFIGPPDPMHAYTSETAPEGWTPKIGKADMILAALSAQTQQEEALRKADHAAKFEEMLANKYGAMLTPEGGITAIPQLRQIQAENAGTEEGAKTAAKLKAEGGGSTKINDVKLNQLRESKALVDEGLVLADKLKGGEVSWTSFHGGKYLSALDKDGTVAAVKDFADKVLRSRSGATAPDKEKSELGRVISGDLSVTPKRAGELIEKFARREASYAKSEMEAGDRGIEAMKNEFSKLATPGNSIPKPSPADYSSFAEYKAAKDAWRASTGG